LDLTSDQVSDMVKRLAMDPADARRKMRDALSGNRLNWSIHQRQRSAQRAVQVADIKDALRSAPLPERSTTNPGEAWLFTGKTETGEILCVVVGYDDNEPTIVSVWWKS
jgi:Domain of unknown function (DUF4258)